MINHGPTGFQPNQLHVAMFYIRIERWHEKMVDACKNDLPPAEYNIAKASLDKFLKRAKALREAGDREIENHWALTAWFVLPWPVLVYYSQMKKK